MLLVIDQLEELFTFCQGDARQCNTQVEQFVANLVDAVQRGAGEVRAVTTLRADFFYHCLAYPQLRDLLQDNQLLLGPMNADALREAIVRPAQEVGALFEPGLVNKILQDVADEPGALPLMQHALYELWLARRGPWLSVDAYEASGGMLGALERRAQVAYEALSVEEKAIARSILLRLVTVGEGMSDTRRRVDRSELYPVGVPRDQVDAVLQVLSAPDARLIVADEQTVQIVHEALIHQWRALRTWIEEDRESLRFRLRLGEAAQDWEQSGRDPSSLYRGTALAEAEQVVAVRPEELAALEYEFINASRDLAKQEQETRWSLSRLFGAFGLKNLEKQLVDHISIEEERRHYRTVTREEAGPDNNGAGLLSQ